MPEIEVKAGAHLGMSPDQWRAVQSAVQGRMMKALIAPPGAVKIKDLKQLQSVSAKVRDQLLWELPLVNAAATTFQDLASTREWAVAGQVNAVSRTIELINNATTVDPDTGMVYTGFERFERQRSLDHIAVGRSAFWTPNSDDKTKISLEYLDPTRLYFKRSRVNFSPRNFMAERVTPEEKIWSYGWNATPTMMHKEVFLHHPIPIGTNRHISPLLLLYPTALLAWLLKEHQTSSLDGRKLREIFLVENGIRDAIEMGVMQMTAIMSGASVTETGLPIVGVNTGNMTKPIMDYVGRLGLSQIPEQFDIKSFMHMYANEIAAAFGLALRQFYNEETTTNRALEDVQEARQQQKGPPAFVRSEQRLINSSQIVRVHATRGNPCRFMYIEESDTQGMKDRATALNLLATGLKQLSEAMGESIDPIIIAQIAQSWDLLPRYVPVEDMLTGKPVGDPKKEKEKAKNGKGEVTISPDNPEQKADEVTVEGNTRKAYDPEAHLQYGDVLMSGDGVTILAKRWPSFAALNKMLRDGLDKEIEAETVVEEEENEDLLDSGVITRYDGRNGIEESLDGNLSPVST